MSSADRRGLRCAAEHGFTLIEIMVALAVFSLAVLALIRLETATARGASILDETLVANLVARNVAVDAVSEGRVPTLGMSSGIEVNAGRSWTWQRGVYPTGNPAIVRIEVAVRGPSGNVDGRATMVRPPDREPDPAIAPATNAAATAT
ncbi:type II secretion system minor pseudopilin GspI [Sphingomonas oligophenolica]|uniref:type II secretion system minor pseudopilin GspI n=1 Tax=Sphingomonas oligophenolica TaxID=301154 RepID=UPI00240D4CF7|nr:type II secretion system minor pseudopilin GspI [Sphingomonas oligophenolica]